MSWRLDFHDLAQYTTVWDNAVTNKPTELQLRTREAIKHIFATLDYKTLAPIYCDEGGDAFWREHRGPCERIGSNLARHLKDHLSPKGHSLYVGAGIAEIPALMMEIHELHRTIAAYNLRITEVDTLNRVCQEYGLYFHPTDAQETAGMFDHIWIVSVLNDPEQYPELSDLSYGRANPVTFDPDQFKQERESALAITRNCLRKLMRPGLITTSVEEIPWITNWCDEENLTCRISDRDYPTAIVKDPVCFIHVS